MKTFNVISLAALVAMFAGITSCNSHSGEIKEMKETLLWESDGEKGMWGIEYPFNFTDNIEFQNVEILTLHQDGEFSEETYYYYEGSALAKITRNGQWDIEYDDDLLAYFFVQEYDDDINIKNLEMNEDWFKRFDTELRLFLKGDAYDVVDYYEDDDTIYGNEIIECSKNLFLVKNLGFDEIYRYEPVKDYQRY